MLMLGLHVCMHTMFMPDTCVGQKNVLDSLELELQTDVNHAVAENRKHWSSARAATGWATSLAPGFTLS